MMLTVAVSSYIFTLEFQKEFLLFGIAFRHTLSSVVGFPKTEEEA